MINKAPDCLECKYFFRIKFGFVCRAFPNGIPKEIVLGKKHHAILDGQEGDYVYEKKKKKA